MNTMTFNNGLVVRKSQYASGEHNFFDEFKFCTKEKEDSHYHIITIENVLCKKSFAPSGEKLIIYEIKERESEICPKCAAVLSVKRLSGYR